MFVDVLESDLGLPGTWTVKGEDCGAQTKKIEENKKIYMYFIMSVKYLPKTLLYGKKKKITTRNKIYINIIVSCIIQSNMYFVYFKYYIMY